jgi:hypothetical protein
MNKVIPTIALTILLLPEVIFAQGTTNNTLINLPINTQDNFGGYINLLYVLSISAAALLAVIKIIIAGVKYMLTDIVTSKGDAIREIKGALLGLLLIIGAVLILTVINPKLLDTTLEFEPEPAPQVNVIRNRPSVQSGNSNTSGNSESNSNTNNSNTSGGENTNSGGQQGNSGGSGNSGNNAAVAEFDYNCVRGTRTQTQGIVTYQYFDLSSCGFANMSTARDYLRNEICKPNAVLNAGNDTYYCKQ